MHHWLCAQPQIVREGKTWHRHTHARCKRCGKQTTFRETTTPDDASAHYAQNKGPSQGGKAPTRRAKRRPKPRPDPLPTAPPPLGDPAVLDGHRYNLG